MGLAEQWKTAKRNFKAATTKKKPANVFLNIRIPSGIEPAAKAYDAAKKKANTKAMRKAEASFMKKVRAYFKVLDAASMKEKGVNYKREMVKLGDALNQMAKSIRRDVEEAESTDRGPERLKLMLKLKKVGGYIDLQRKDLADIEVVGYQFGRFGAQGIVVLLQHAARAFIRALMQRPLCRFGQRPQGQCQPFQCNHRLLIHCVLLLCFLSAFIAVIIIRRLTVPVGSQASHTAPSCSSP